MSRDFVFSMLFKADTAAAKAAIGGVREGLAAVGGEAKRARASTAAQAAELEELARASARAAQNQTDLAAGMRQAQLSVVPSGKTFDLSGAVADYAGMRRAATGFCAASETAADRTRAAIAGLNTTVAGAGREMMAAAGEARLWQSALDDIRSSFNPVFAASRQYEAALARIAEAERLGAISAREAATAREEAAAAMAPAALPGARRTGAVSTFGTANLAAQGNDIIMMAAAGQNPLQLALQQGTQVSQYLNTLEKGASIPKALAAGFMSMVNPVSLVTIGVIGLGAAAVQMAGKLVPQTKSAAEALKDLGTAIDSYAAAQEAARRTDLAPMFGAAAGAARGLLLEMEAITRQQKLLDVKSAFSGLQRDITGGSRWGMNSASAQFGSLQTLFGEGSWRTNGLPGAADSPHSAAVGEALGGLTSALTGDDLDNQIANAVRLKDALDAAASAAGGITDEERAWQLQIGETLLELRKLKALDQNAFASAKAKELTDQLARRVELEQTATRYGAQSSEVRAVEARHAREALATELERAGVAKGSADWTRAMAEQARASLARNAAADAARDAAQEDYLRGQQTAIAAIDRERALLGATASERAAINALATVENDIRERGLGLITAQLARTQALGKAAAEVSLERARSARALQAGLVDDGFAVAVSSARDPLTKADLEYQREYARLVTETGDRARAAAEAERVRSRSLNEALTASRGNVVAMSDELAARQAVAAQIASGAATAGDATRLMQLELELRPLVAAAARAEGTEKARLTDVILGLRLASEALAAEDRRAQANDLLRGGAERIAATRVELALIGASAEARARVLGLIEAERDIRRLQLDDSGKEADALRRNAVEQARVTAELERQGDAWKKVQSAGESAIDGVLGKLTGGDFKGALAELAGQASKLVLELGVANPLKNAVLGTNLGTMDDLGGMRGIVGRLLGGVDERALVAQGSAPVQSMQVAAATVQITAGAVNWAGGGPVAANLPFAPAGALAAASATGPVAVGAPAEVARQIWDFFSAKGLAAHQVAAVVGHAKAESGFNPVNVGDGGDAHGLFQWNDRAPKLFDFIGGSGSLGDVNKQLEFAWRELMTTENSSYRKLIAAPDVASATWAMQGFERPSGYKAGIYGTGDNWQGRLDAANQAFAQLGGTAAAATTQVAGVGPAMGQVATGAQTTAQSLGDLGQDMGQFGGALSQILGSAVSGNKGGVLSGLLGLGAEIMKGAGKTPGAAVPGFAVGGYTGTGHPASVAGVVHAGEYVFDAQATRAIGVDALEAIRRGRMRGYASGGYVSAAPARAPAGGGMSAGESGGAMGGSGGNQPPVMNFDMRGAIGGAELQKGVRTAIQQSLELYDRDVLPGRVKRISSKTWSAR